jgi:S1-C subfamily serine protease
MISGEAGASSAPTRPNKRRHAWIAAGVLLAVVFVVVLAVGLSACAIEVGSPTTTGGGTATTSPPATSGGTGSTATTATPATLPAGEAEVSPAQTVADLLGPSVVNIAISGVTDSPFGQQQYAGEGSGVIYTSDGLIITNNHVVTDENGEPVDTIEVTLATGEKLPATIVGRDPLTDLAVISVQPGRDLPAATFLDGMPQVGEYAIAIGSPLGYENSVTMGVVSGLARSIEGVSGPEGVALTNLIQTDASISPGNSGGALANAMGQVMGINVAYLPPGQTGAVSIGFAIPSVVATQVADQIIETGKATHAYIGIGPQMVTPALQQQFGLSRSSGVLVAEVTPGGPASKAGIQQGDIIVAVDGQEMVESADVLIAIRDRQPGDVVELTIDRNGETMTVNVTLEERPAGQ